MTEMLKFRLFGIFRLGSWIYGALVEDTISYYIPIMLMPSHKAYLDLLSHPDAPIESLGPYSVMSDSWKSLGIVLKSIGLELREDSNGRKNLYGVLKLVQENNIGKQIGVISIDPTEAVLVHAVEDVPILVPYSIASEGGVPFPDNIKNDDEAIRYIEESMVKFKNDAEELKSFMTGDALKWMSKIENYFEDYDYDEEDGEEGNEDEEDGGFEDGHLGGLFK